MSTRSTTHFVSGGRTEAIIYRHCDGYPEGHGWDLARFFEAIETQTDDRRYDDAPYLAAKLVVWLAGEFGNGAPLDFLSVGVIMEDPGDEEYRYEVDCSEHGPDGRPLVRCFAAGPADAPGRQIPIPPVEVSA